MKNLAFVFAAISSLASFAGEEVLSPDGRLAIAVDGAKYEIRYDCKMVIEPSSLGFVADIGDFGKDLEIKEVKRSEFRDSYSVPTLKKSHVEVKANRMRVDYGKFAVLFHVSNNDVAFRYEIPKQGKDTRCVRIMDEKTSFTFPEGTTAFITPQSKPMIGWMRSKPSYEEEYLIDVALPATNKYGCGWTFPALFKTEQSLWVLISETGTDSRYCGCRLGEFDGRTTKIEFPMPGENNGSGTVEPAFALPGVTPWRTITVADNLAPIVETTIAWDVVKPKYDAKPYRYGRSSWSWIIWDDASMNWRDQVTFIDLAAEMGWEYILVDALWDTAKDIGYEKLPELVKYAASKGVGVFLWYNSNGAWNNTPQGPREVMSDPIARKREMRWLKSIGVKGLKVDFWGGDKQETFRLYEQVLSDADDNDLMIIFHGCTIPRGWERMYPNYVGSEAVLASENRHFSKRYCEEAGKNASLHPFIRNTIGCMEYGGTFLNERMSRDNKKKHPRGTTVDFELATAILFQNPIQNFALTPNNLTDAPAYAIDFMKAIPTTWDETRYLAGYPGKYAAIARRHGDKWYIAAVAAEQVEFELDLTLFGGSKETVKLSRNDGFWRVFGEDRTYVMVYHKDMDHALHIAVSGDSYNWRAVNGDRPIVDTTDIAQQKGIRDPFIAQSPDGTFVVAMTDLHCFGRKAGIRNTEWERSGREFGWGNNHGLVLLTSRNLIDWDKSRIEFFDVEGFGPNTGCTWAPELVWDEGTQSFLMHFTARFGNGHTEIWAAHLAMENTASSDNEIHTVVKLAEKPFRLHAKPYDILDSDIVFGDDGLWHMFYCSHEKGEQIIHATSKNLTGPYTEIAYDDGERRGHEAPNCWRRPDGTWVVMWDGYCEKPHNFGFVESRDLATFKPIGYFDGESCPMKRKGFSEQKHGSVIAVNDNLVKKLEERYK